MCIFSRSFGRGSVLLVVGAWACQEPGADWQPDAGATGITTSSDTTGTGTMGGNVTGESGPTSAGMTSTSTVTATSSDVGGTTGTATSDAASAGGTAGVGGLGGAASTETNAISTETSGTGGTGGSVQGSLITNGDFSDGETGWNFAGNGVVQATGDDYCVVLNEGGSVQVSWPDAVDPAVIAGGVDYRFSYQAWNVGGGAPSLNIKLGQAFEPYEPFFDPVDITLSTSSMTYTHEFTGGSSDQAGILFTISGENGDRVCFDNVALVAL